MVRGTGRGGGRAPSSPRLDPSEAREGDHVAGGGHVDGQAVAHQALDLDPQDLPRGVLRDVLPVGKPVGEGDEVDGAQVVRGGHAQLLQVRAVRHHPQRLHALAPGVLRVVARAQAEGLGGAPVRRGPDDELGVRALRITREQSSRFDMPSERPRHRGARGPRKGHATSQMPGPAAQLG